MTLPIPIVVNSFANYYKNRLWRNEVAVKKDVNILLDPRMTYSEVLDKLCWTLETDPDNVELFKCYASKSMMKRSAEFPVDVESEKNLESLLEWCKEGPKTIFYRIKNDGSSSEDEQLQESSFSK